MRSNTACWFTIAIPELIFLAVFGCESIGDSRSSVILDPSVALQRALRHASETLHFRRIHRSLIKIDGGRYHVSLTETTKLDRRSRSAFLSVDRFTGAVSNLSHLPFELRPQEPTSSPSYEASVSHSHALKAALIAVESHEHFDREGQIDIELRGEEYVVVLPLTPRRQDGERIADYAYRIRIDAGTAEVVEILTSN